MEETSTSLPDVALRWILLHATTSNVELANFSNVSRSWRGVVTTVILEQATYKTLPSVPMLLLPSMASQLIRVNDNDKSAAQSSHTMIDNSGAQSAAAQSAAAVAGIVTKTDTAVPSTSTATEETFCAAWFAPEGVQFLDLDEEQVDSDPEDGAPLDADDDKSSRPHLHRHCRHPSTNNGGGGRSKSPMMSLNVQRRPPNLEQIPQHHSWSRGFGNNARRVASFHEQGIVVTHEWQGYRHAMDILFPFGYTDNFVQHVLQQAAQLQNPISKEQQQPSSESENSVMQINQSTESHHLSDCLEDQGDGSGSSSSQMGHRTNTTIAVRGATIARPEGYCLCWENPALPSAAAAAPEPMEWSRQSSHSNNSNSNNSENNNNNEDMVHTIKQQERQRKLRQWKEWRRQLQLTVLPQVLVRSPPHSSAAVQFLNSDEKHAVRLMTPQFACGPIGEPVTIIVVGIATEDGCFCSGLQHRFELGHLYPNSELMELAELSPICMATDRWEVPAGTRQPQQQGGGDESSKNASSSPTKTPLEQHLSDDDSEDDSEDDYEDDSSSDLAGTPLRPNPTKKRGWLDNCTCIFNDNSNPLSLGGGGANEKSGNENQPNPSDTAINSVMREDSQTLRVDDDEDEKDEEGDAERILRGSRIPGVWHCYAAVFDGKTYSTLRVDGIEEVLTRDGEETHKSAIDDGESTDKGHHQPKRKKDDGSRPHPARRGPRAMLDGLTIGSDHCFDMTLCFGQGSGGEGEGAIAEIAVFSGRLDTQDLQVLEKQLMVKHGIPVPAIPRTALLQEDEWTRKSTALYCQTPAESAAYGASLSVEQDSVPLRIMTKHRSVSWHQFNAVTGEELRIKRIGSRSAGSSSDW